MGIDPDCRMTHPHQPTDKCSGQVSPPAYTIELGETVSGSLLHISRAGSPAGSPGGGWLSLCGRSLHGLFASSITADVGSDAEVLTARDKCICSRCVKSFKELRQPAV